MDAQALYGLFLILYIVPYWVWMIARDQKLEILKQFYPGRADEKALERQEYKVGGLWTAGLVLLLAGWSLKWHPVPTLLLVALLWAVGLIFTRISLLRSHFQTRRARSAIAVSVVWCLLVLGWYIIFGDRYGFEVREVMLLALVPIPIGFIAYAAFIWVGKARR